MPFPQLYVAKLHSLFITLYMTFVVTDLSKKIKGSNYWGCLYFKISQKKCFIFLEGRNFKNNLQIFPIDVIPNCYIFIIEENDSGTFAPYQYVESDLSPFFGKNLRIS